MKKVFLVLLSFLLVLLTACSGQTGSSNAEDNTLRVIMIADPWVDVMKEFGQKYEKETGIKVEVSAYSYDQTHQKEILLGNQKSSAADVIVLDSPWVGEFAEGGIVEDLTSRIEKTPELNWNDFIPSFRDVAKWKGQTVGVPFAPYYVMLHYRKDLFEKEGFEPPKNYEELIRIADHFTDNPDYPGMYGIAMNNERGAPVGQAYFEHIWHFGKPFKSMEPGSKDPYSNMTPLLSSPESVAVVKMFKDLLKYQPPGALNYAWDERAQAFAQGKVAMIMAWSVRTPGFLDEERSQVGDKFDTAIVPTVKGKEPVPPLGGWLMGINKYSENKERAWEFIKWMNSKEVHKEFVLKGGPPARLSELNDPDLKEKFPWFDTQAESAEKAFADCRPRIPESFQIIDTVGNHISEALSGKLSVEQAMKQANDQVRNLMIQGGYKVD